MPDLLNKHQIIPGISDHDIPILDIDTHAILNKKALCKVYIHSKGNMSSLINELSDYSHKFERKYDDSTHSNIDEMWLEFKKAVQKAIGSNIPSKRISGSKTNLPCIINSIRKMIRKRNAAYHRQRNVAYHRQRNAAYHRQRNVAYHR